MKKMYLFMVMCVFTFFGGCSSDDGGSFESKIIGTWEGYAMISEENEDIHDFKPGDKIMEFKTNGTFVFTEFGYINVMTYVLDDDILETRKQNGDVDRTYRVLQLDSKELRLDLLDGRKMYYKKMK